MISLAPLAFAFLPCAAADEAAAARLRLQVELPPVPAYPADGVIPEELWKRFVFLDEEAGELILSFPPDFDEENPASGEGIDGPRVTARAPLAIGICPSLSAAVRRADDGEGRGYVYRYRLANRRGARLPISKWVMPVAGGEAVESVLSPPRWFAEDWGGPRAGEDMRNALEGLTYSWGDAHQRKMRRSMLRRRLLWYLHFSRDRLQPGDALPPFGFTTETRPGIVRAYVQGPRGISTRSNWPWALKEQLWAFQFIENNSLSISTIGPKFAPDADKTAIAADFLENVEGLVESGELPAQSPFVRETFRLLESVAESGFKAADLAAWPARPTVDFEAEILSAIRLSLGD